MPEIHVMSVTSGEIHPVKVEVAQIVYPYKPYDGSYEITPTQYEQTIDTTSRLLLDDLVIKPIPQNYGLITWNGAFLTIS